MKNLIQELEQSKAYCEQYNGRPDCKNCRTDFDVVIKHLRAGEELRQAFTGADSFLGTYACGEHIKVRKILHKAIKAYDDKIKG